MVDSDSCSFIRSCNKFGFLLRVCSPCAACVNVCNSVFCRLPDPEGLAPYSLREVVTEILYSLLKRDFPKNQRLEIGLRLYRSTPSHGLAI